MSAIGLAMKFTADTGGIKQGAAETSKLLNGLSKDVSRAQATFSQFSSSNNAAAAAQQQLATDASFLASALRTGQISAEQFKEELAGLSAAASQQAAAFQEGAALTERYTSAEQKRAAELERLSQLLDAGAISQETYNRAAYEASGAAAAAAEQAKAAKVAEAEAAKQAAAEAAAAAEVVKAAEQARAAVVAEGASVTARYATEQEKQTAEMNRLQGLLDAGAISQETYAAAVYDASGAAKEAEAAEASKAKAMSRGESITKGLQTEEEKYADTVAELEDLLQKGAISQQTFNRAMDKAEGELGGVEKGAHDASGALNKMTGYLKIIAAIEIGRVLAAGFKSAVNAINGFASSVMASASEIGKLAQVSNASVNEFQRIAFAARTVGIEQDKMADILKDVNDRIGDFIQTGGGPMADFFENIAPKVGVTAEQFARLSGPEALQLYVDSLEKAGLSQQEMTFYLEAIASETTALIPLLQNGGAAMDGLADRAERLGVVLSEDQTTAIKQMNGALSQVQATFEGIIGQVTANLAPAVTQMTEQFLSFVTEFDKFGGGGTGIANAITDGLLKFGIVLAQIFDKAIAGFNNFADNFDDNVASFSGAINIFSSITDALKVVFLSFQNFGLFLRRVAANIINLFGGDGESIADIAERQAQTRAQIDAALAGIGGAGQRVLEGGGLRAEGEDAGPIEQVVLDLIERRQKALAEGVGEAVEQSENIFSNAAATQIKSFTNKAVSATKTLFGDISQSVQKAFEETRKRNQAIADLNARYAEESAKIEEDRLDKLAEVNQKALEATDIRSGGISQVLALATGREDPAVAEARAQRKELEKISREIGKLGGTVEIVGAA